MSKVRITWKDPNGTLWSALVDDLNEASREERRLRRGGCTDVKVFSDVNLLGPIAGATR